MKLLGVILVVGLSGCSNYPMTVAFRGDPPEGMTARQYECKLTGKCLAKPPKPESGDNSPLSKSPTNPAE